MSRLILALAISTLVGCGSGYSADYANLPVMSRSTSAGEILTTDDGMTLYTFDRDAQGMSACYDTCAKNWPPFMAGPDAREKGDFTLMERNDGGIQWAYEGKPLYRYIGDRKPGDVSGNGFKGVWHVQPAKEARHQYRGYGSSYNGNGNGGGY
ncbi:hypothetical protein GCM10011352_09680 [Marinobacterium zhoushanense]|uniref:Lipoprotein with Yx(FWY)xxD motif n=1 Tax=Marinobacterium zhoushanense TaxID=1679163 RepID=A0ABQ1K2J4_9GAMM|nr:hypothetical protein [Marinobacterium zhoushanense]GGB85857.1 hypothetical protein GCM10011352_09680 [Marinobacterium zhoushanense]